MIAKACLVVSILLGSAFSAVTQKDTAYKVTPDTTLTMRLWFPDGWSSSDRRAAVVFVHGGGYRGGALSQFANEAAYFASRGLLTASVMYRLPGMGNDTDSLVKPDKCIEDCKSAIRWVRQRSGALGIDPNRIVGAGASAGGHAIFSSAVNPNFDDSTENLAVSSRPNLLVLYCAAYIDNSLGARYTDLAKADQTAMGVKLDPLTYLDKNCPPSLTLYGVNDGFLNGGAHFNDTAQCLGLDAQLLLADSVGHMFFDSAPWLDRTNYLVDKFLGTYGYVTGNPTIVLPGDSTGMYARTPNPVCKATVDDERPNNHVARSLPVRSVGNQLLFPTDAIGTVELLRLDGRIICSRRIIGHSFAIPEYLNGVFVGKISGAEGVSMVRIVR